jgi:uncharacterized protein YcaQ
MHELTLQEARRIAVQAQLLDAPRPTDLLAVVRQLTLLQIDPTAAVAPNAHLVAWSRLGSAYRSDELRKALEEDRTLFEFAAMIRPIEDLPLRVHDLLPVLPATELDGGQRPVPARRPRSAPRRRPPCLA